MANLVPSLTGMFRDPPPELAFELSEAGISAALTRHPAAISFTALPAGAISPSPLHDNVLMPEALAAAVGAAAPRNGNKKRRAALILPDYCARVSVLDFDSLPDDAKERDSLVRFRIKKSVPFDVESAALSYWPQPIPGGKSHDVVVAVAPREIIARYEAPFRAAGIHAGLVTTSSLACLDLAPPEGIQAIAKINGHVLTIMVLQNGMLKLIRSLELTELSVAEIATDLYPTFVYIEDHFSVRANVLLLCAFGDLEETARRQFHAELGIPVESVRSGFAPVNDRNAGLLGYLQGQAARS